MPNDIRPDPNAVLAETEKARRGKLKLFLGMAPGVGKTYAMLAEARQVRASGHEILIGWVDTHGRTETQALTEGLDILPRRRARRGSMEVGALDIDEILRRRPPIVVIDEMPHSNPPGSRHPKRWQDIEEILDMGIDVWSALNIQHLESLNGVVARVTGVTVSETVPDRIFDEADEVRFIDLPPDDLINRLQAGKIYLPKVVERAKEAFFRKSNLVALRELALRCMASRMESQIRSERLRSTRRSVEDTNYGLLLAMEFVSEEAVREAARLARALSARWHVVWFDGGFGVDRSESDAVADLLKFAESLGAVCDNVAGDYGVEVGRYAREHNLSLVAVVAAGGWGLTRRRRQLKRHAPELNLIAFASLGRIHASLSQRLKIWLSGFTLGFDGYWQAALVVIALGAFLYPMREVMEPTNHGMIYLLGVLFAGVRFGSGPAALAAVLSVIIFDFSVIAPFWSFTVDDSQYIITFAVMLIVGLVAGQLVGRGRLMAKTANRREHQTRMLYDASRELSQTLIVEEALRVLSGTLLRHLRIESEFWRPTWPDDEAKREHPDELELVRVEAALKGVDPAVVRWCYEHHHPAGAGTQTLASSPCWYLPMQAGGKVLAVMAVRTAEGSALGDASTRRLVETLATLGAQTLLRLEASAEARQTLISMEAERLRHSLIQSLSHDLRTPITMLKVAAEGLVAKLRGGRHAGALETAESLLEGSSRMERLVANLLEMARLQTGAIQLSRCWIPAEELFGTALAEQGERLRGYRVKTEVDEDCPLVYGDEVLLVRVLSNLLDNAVKYCPAGSSILLSARRRGDLLALTVADNGPGLPDGDPQRLFDPFRRGRKEASVAGVGLGLAICRTIARAHDAQIYATSSSMGGAAFTLMLPMVPLEEALDDEEVVLARGREDADEPLDPPLAATVCDKTASTVRAALGKIVVKKQNSDNKTAPSGGNEPTEEVEAGGGRP